MQLNKGLSILLSSYLLLIIPVIASLINRTIDDEFGDSVTGAIPTYTPQGWAQGQNCTGCTIYQQGVNISKVFRGSWHDATHIPKNPDFNITASFSGVAVYVFNLIALQTPTNLTFYLDGVVADTFFHPVQPNADGIQYRVPVLSKTGLSNGPHTLEIVAGGPTDSLVLFDYIEYTVDDDSGSTPTSTSSLSSGPSTPTEQMTPATSTQAPHSRVAAILGGAVGGGAALTCVFAVVYLIRRRRCIQPHPLHSSPEKLNFHEDDGVAGTRRGELTARVRRYSSSSHPSRLSDTSPQPFREDSLPGRSV